MLSLLRITLDPRGRTPAVRKGIPAFPLHLQRRQSEVETLEDLQGSCHNSKGLQCPNLLQIHLIPLH